MQNCICARSRVQIYAEHISVAYLPVLLTSNTHRCLTCSVPHDNSITFSVEIIIFIAFKVIPFTFCQKHLNLLAARTYSNITLIHSELREQLETGTRGYISRNKHHIFFLQELFKYLQVRNYRMIPD